MFSWPFSNSDEEDDCNHKWGSSKKEELILRPGIMYDQSEGRLEFCAVTVITEKKCEHCNKKKDCWDIIESRTHAIETEVVEVTDET